MQNLILRYWLAAGGIDPDRQASITTLRDGELVKALSQQQLTGFCAEEPWNSQAVQQRVGYMVATDLDIWQGHPEKVLGIREDWVNQHPQTHIALIKALIEACDYCDDPRHRQDWLTWLTQPEYGGLKATALHPSLIGPLDRGDGQSPATLLRFHQFHIGQSNCPVRIEALWILTQFARWGMTPFPKNWLEIMERVRRVDLYGEAARQLGLPDIEPASRTPFALFDGLTFDPDRPLAYLESLTLRQEIVMAEIPLATSGLRAA
jgi:nitrate/nitrite transport system ATP-binding protein